MRLWRAVPRPPDQAMLIVLPSSAVAFLSRVTSRSPLLYSAFAESTSTSHGSARSFSNFLLGESTLMERTLPVHFREMSSLATPGISATALTREPSSVTSVKNSLTSPEPSALSLLPEFPNSFTCLTPSGPWYIVYPYVFTSGPVMSICENMSSILLFRLSKPPKRSFQMSSAAP